MENYRQIREDAKDLIYHELGAIVADGQLSTDCVHIFYELVDIIKDLEEIDEKEMMNMGGEGYSNRGRMMPRYYDGNSYGSGNYNISGNYNNRGGGSMMRGRSGGYSRNDERTNMINKLEELMNEVHDDRDKEYIRRMLAEEMK